MGYCTDGTPDSGRTSCEAKFLTPLPLSRGGATITLSSREAVLHYQRRTASANTAPYTPAIASESWLGVPRWRLIMMCTCILRKRPMNRLERLVGQKKILLPSGGLTVMRRRSGRSGRDEGSADTTCSGMWPRACVENPLFGCPQAPTNHSIITKQRIQHFDMWPSSICLSPTPPHQLSSRAPQIKSYA